MGNGAARENIRMGSGEVTLLGEARDWGTEARSDEQRKSINANGEMSQGCEGRKWGNWGWMDAKRSRPNCAGANWMLAFGPYGKIIGVRYGLPHRQRIAPNSLQLERKVKRYAAVRPTRLIANRFVHRKGRATRRFAVRTFSCLPFASIAWETARHVQRIRCNANAKMRVS